MLAIQPEQPGWFDWLQLEPSFVPERAENLLIGSLLEMELNGRFLYLKGTSDLAELKGGERRILEALARHGDTVFVAVGNPGQIELAFRLPDTDNAVAFGADGLRGLIQQWSAWAKSSQT